MPVKKQSHSIPKSKEQKVKKLEKTIHDLQHQMKTHDHPHPH
jgi:hypothetical protein